MEAVYLERHCVHAELDWMFLLAADMATVVEVI